MTGDDRDRVYAGPLADIAGFRFDHRVAAVFPDMIKRSVPGYETIVAMTGTLAERYARPGTRLYDLGCSLGASTLAMAGGIGQRDALLIAVDNAEAMVERCQQVIAEARRQEPDTVEPQLVCADVRDLAIADASMVVLNFTLQFIPVAERNALLDRIYRGLVPGGILVLSEKVVFADSHHNDLMIELHHSFKRANGYSELEISRKRNALENVLIPETLDSHRRRLKTIGFGSVDVWFQCFNFASLLAIKEH